MSLEDTSKTPTEIIVTSSPPLAEPSLVAKTDFAFLMVAVSFTIGSLADVFSQISMPPHRFVPADWEITIWVSVLGLKTVTSMIANNIATKK